MIVSASTLRKLAALNLNPDQMAGVLEMLAEQQEAEDARKAAQRERTRKSRANRDSNVTATSPSQDGNGTPLSPKENPQTPKETTPISPTTPKENPPKGGQKKAVRLPSDWALPAEWRRWAIDAGLPADRCDLEATKMLNWSINAGSKGAKRDWFRAWQNWALGAIDNLPKARGSPSRQPFEKPDHFKTQALELADEQDRSSRSDSRDWDDAESFPILAIDYQR